MADPFDNTPFDTYDGRSNRGAFGSSGSASPPGVPEFRALRPLPPELLPVESFDLELLPSAFAPWVEDIAERLQCPPDFSAVAAMAAYAAVVGRRVGIRPKRQDDWLVVPNLWAVAIGRPGVMKTPAILEPMRPLHALEAEARKVFDEQERLHQANIAVAKQRAKVAEKEIQKALRDNRDAQQVALSALGQESKAPVRRRLIVNDSSVEKLGELLNENPNGLLVFRDELVGFLRSLDRDGQEGARAFYLEAWNGAGRFTYDRIGRGTVEIESTTISALGGIQPGPLREYLAPAVRSGLGDDGLMQRFQLAVWPDISTEWRNVDRWPDSAARKRAYAAFEAADQFDADAVGAEPEGSGEIPWLRFDTEAQTLFDRWRTTLERKVRSGKEHPAIEAHLSKFRSLVPSLALLIHLADAGKGLVSAPALRRALGWAEYLGSHARRIYGAGIAPQAKEARLILEHILDGDLPDGFTLKDVYRPCWSGLADRDAALRGTELLVDHGYLAEQELPTPGRWRSAYRINPRIREGEG